MNIINSNHEARCCSWSHMNSWLLLNHTVVTNCIPLIRTRLFHFPDPSSLFPPPLSLPTNYQTEGSGARLPLNMVVVPISRVQTHTLSDCSSRACKIKLDSFLLQQTVIGGRCACGDLWSQRQVMNWCSSWLVWSRSNWSGMIVSNRIAVANTSIAARKWLHLGGGAGFMLLAPEPLQWAYRRVW